MTHTQVLRSSKVKTFGLGWTGHALIDVGVAGVCGFTNRKRPEDVTLEDLDKVADLMVQNYYEMKLGTYLSCVFMNASFVQPNEKEPKRKEFIERYLRAHRAEPDPIVVHVREGAEEELKPSPRFAGQINARSFKAKGRCQELLNRLFGLSVRFCIVTNVHASFHAGVA
jgi:hypothetical protein